jgi:hypothetical protein
MATFSGNPVPALTTEEPQRVTRAAAGIPNMADAVSASAGSPGTFNPYRCAVPANLAAMPGVVANPTTAWLAGQYVDLVDGSDAQWNGTAWIAGGELPTLATVAPAAGGIAGGTAVTLGGTGLLGATGVTFGGTAATAVVVVRDTQITCTAPAHAAGAADVVVTTPFGTSTKTGGFTYS